MCDVVQCIAVFLSGAVNMTEPEVKAFIAGFINSHLNVDTARSVASFLCEDFTVIT